MASDVIVYEERSLTKDEQLTHILSEVASGRSLHSILTEDAGMPPPSTFWRWHLEDEVFQGVFARARENGVEALMEKAIHIAENPIEAVELVEEVGPNGVKRKRTVKEALGHRRLIIDTYIKRAQMIKPRVYGAKLPEDEDQSLATSIATGIVEGAKRLQRAGLTKE